MSTDGITVHERNQRGGGSKRKDGSIAEDGVTVHEAQKGGRLVGQGQYGCIFDPAPRCAGGRVFHKVNGKRAVGKVTVEDITDEMNIGRAIMALPMASNYFALPSDHCKPLKITDPDVDSCKVLRGSLRSSALSMMIMPDAGAPLIAWATDLDRLARDYERVFIHLLEGIEIYQKIGYVHNDIHMGNVLVDEMDVARYIDFGLSFRVTDIKTWSDSNLNKDFKPRFFWHPPEVHAWRMEMSGVGLVDGARQLKENNSEYAKLEHQFPSHGSLEGAVVRFMGETENDAVAFLRKYAKKIDHWRIGMMMWLLWVDLTESPNFMETELWKERRDTVRRVLDGLTQFDPRKRWTPVEALAALSA